MVHSVYVYMSCDDETAVFFVSVLFCDVECILWSDRLRTMVYRPLQCGMYDAQSISVNQ